jgi:hypothetical protein
MFYRMFLLFLIAVSLLSIAASAPLQEPGEVDAGLAVIVAVATWLVMDGGILAVLGQVVKLVLAILSKVFGWTPRQGLMRWVVIALAVGLFGATSIYAVIVGSSGVAIDTVTQIMTLLLKIVTTALGAVLWYEGLKAGGILGAGASLTPVE